ncbi:MAG: c-type cytochrome [Burkholderiaceae bacterium]
MSRVLLLLTYVPAPLQKACPGALANFLLVRAPFALLCVWTLVCSTAQATEGGNLQAQASAASPGPASEVGEGQSLAALGACGACHSVPNEPSYSGGRPLQTPYGTIYSTNLTPDRATGIGNWSYDTFARAMREGIGADGQRLYPAFPYDHFTLTREEDLKALYAFLFSLEPVPKTVPANRLDFPWNVRQLLAIWDALYLKPGTFEADTTKSANYNRGSYLVQSLGHCGSCHTPRNVFGAEDRGSVLSGARLEGWYAPALNAQSPSPAPWSAKQMTQYLREGIAPDHAMAAGPMQSVVASLQEASQDDVAAMAVYLTSLMNAVEASQRRQWQDNAERASRGLLNSPAPEARVTREGAAVYAGSCATCHEQGRLASSSSGLPLPLAIALYDPDPRSFLRIVREGINPLPGERGRWMPAFDGLLTKEELKALATYLRRYAAALPEWSDFDRAIEDSSVERPPVP